ncbi:MAG: carboxypeptidase regulatory-like domain-containing protein [Clostridiales Family XIII bacterium]|jgi:hypothetical protein|nr:carboxypeptidase regulatory-like domain-containing protein [Clostridiales Family XIII bacterium]
MKKWTKRLLTLILTAALVLSGAAPAFADGTGAQEPEAGIVLDLENPDGTDAGPAPGDTSGVPGEAEPGEAPAPLPEPEAEELPENPDQDGNPEEWIPFEPLAEEVESQSIRVDETPYFASQGAWAVPIYNAYFYGEPGTWVEATLTSEDGETVLQRDFYIANQSRAYLYDALIYANGVLFLGDTPAGFYEISLPGAEPEEPQTLSNRLVVAGAAAPYVTAADFLGLGSVYLPAPAQNSIDWIGAAFQSNGYMESPSYYYGADNYYSNGYYGIEPDGGIYAYVKGYGLKASDILDAALVSYEDDDGLPLAGLDKIIPGSGIYGAQEFYLRLAPTDDFYSASSNFNKQLVIQFADGVSGRDVSDQGVYSVYASSPYGVMAAYLDPTHISEGRVDIIPNNAGIVVLPSTLEVQFMRTVDGGQEYIDLEASLVNGRYQLTLPLDIYLFETGAALQFALPDQGFYLNLGEYDIFQLDFFTSHAPDINGETFTVYPEALPGFSREDAAFSIADASFTPYPGVTVAKTASDLYRNTYTVSAEGPLPAGSYYLLFGSLPVKEFTVSAGGGAGGGGSGTGTANSVFSSGSIYASDSFYFQVNTPGTAIDAAAWSVQLKDTKTGAVERTFSLADGFTYTESGTGYQYFKTDAGAVQTGTYRVAYYNNGAAIDPEDFPNLGDYDALVVVPDGTGIQINDFYPASDPKSIRIEGHVGVNTAVSGWTLRLYETAIPFLNPVHRSAGVPAFTTGSSGRFEVDVPANALGISEPGQYWAVLEDSAGNILSAGTVQITKTLLSASDSVVLSGSVLLRGNAAPELTVELWKNGSKIEEARTLNGQFSFTGIAKNSSYTVKIAAGSTWLAYEESYDIGDTGRSVQISLSSATASYTVSGIVQAGGAPVSGYVLGAYAYAGGTAAATAAATAATNASGAYSLNLLDGTYVIIGRSATDYKEYQSEPFTVSGADIAGKNITLLIRPYAGGVVTLNGTPQAGLYVYLYKVEPTSGYETYVRSANTAADGAFQFKGLEENTDYVIRVDSYDYQGSKFFTSGAEGRTETNIGLVAFANLSGRLTLDGVPQVNVYVKLRVAGNSGYLWGYTDSNGTYSFTRLSPETGYTLTVDGTVRYEAYSESVDLSAGGAITKDIALAPIPVYGVTFNIVNGGSDVLTLYVYSNNYYVQEQVAQTEGVFTTALPSNSYTYHYSYAGIYGSGNFTVNGAPETVSITLPTIYTISGVISDSAGPVEGATVRLAAVSYQTVYSGADGSYTFKMKAFDGPATIEAHHETAGYALASFTVNGSLNKNIELKRNRVIVTVRRQDTGAGIAGAYVNIGGAAYGYTDGTGQFTLNNVPSGVKSYSAYAADYFMAYGTTLINTEGDMAVIIELQRNPSADYVFSLHFSSDEIATGSFVDLLPVLEYTGSGAPQGGTVSIQLPAGLEPAAGGLNGYAITAQSATYTTYAVAYGIADGKIKIPALRITADDTIGNLYQFSISAWITTGAFAGIKSGYGTLTVVNSTLTAPGVVQAGESFKVYGTAPANSLVSIVDENGNVLDTVPVTNRYYSTTVSLAAGAHSLQAIALTDTQTVYSPVAPVYAEAGLPPAVKNINITNGYLSGTLNNNNLAYGVPTFSTWVLWDYAKGDFRGIYNIAGLFEIANLGDYTVKEITFAGATTKPVLESGKYSFTFGIGTWNGLGVKPIVLTLTKGGVEYHFTIAIVTILIDPSGYVYDALTGEPVEGATVTLEVKQGSGWAKWVDADKLQANPLTSDEEGRYGWYVPNGEYRVRVTAPNYADAIANQADGTFLSTSLDGIPVPPEQTEVNVPLTYTGKPTVTASAQGGKVVLTFSRPMKDGVQNDITIKVGGEEVEGSFAVSANKKVFTFTPATAFELGTTVQVGIESSALSQDGIAIGAVSIPAVRITESSTTDPGDDEDNDSDDESNNNNSDNSGVTPPSGGTSGGGSPSGGSTTTTPIANVPVPLAPAAAAPASTFTDTAGHWAEYAIGYVVSKSLFNGVGDNRFAPNATMTRAMFVTVLARLADGKAAGSASFLDVPAGQWYTDGVLWAAENDIVQGVGNGNFAPNQDITREQLAVMFYNYAKFAGLDTAAMPELSFADSDRVSDWAREAMAWASAKGLITGKPATSIVTPQEEHQLSPEGSNLLDPQGNATRAEVATILMRFLES